METKKTHPDQQNFSKIIEADTERVAKRNGAFVAIYCREMRPYVAYNGPLFCSKDQSFAQVLMQLRWDGVFGFPGGKVDPGETLREAAAREVREEIGFAVEPASLVPICTHMEAGSDFAAHLYACEVDQAGFQAAILSSWSGRDFSAEVCGVIAPRISLAGLEQGRGIFALINSAPMSFSARHELILVIQRLHLLGEVDMTLFNAGLSTNGWQ